MADLLAFSVLWALGWALLWRVPGPPPGAGRARPAVAVVIPARDEEETLPALLASLVPQLAAGDEAVVVDDHSADATAAVASATGARVVPAPDLPEGWTGKAWACATGADAVTAPVLVFLDADVRLHPAALDRLVALAGEGAGLASVQPFHVVPRPVERLAAFFNLVGVMGTLGFTVLGRRAGPARGAFGPCLVTRVADYRRAGGHAAVKGEVLDDVALAARYRDAGLAVRLRGGRGVVDYRMYASGLGALVEGFTKNIAGGARAAGVLGALGVAAWLTACTAPLVLALRLPGEVALAAYLLVALQVHVHLRRLGSFGPAVALLYAVPLAAFLLVFARSAALTLLGRPVRWKGRRVPTRSGGGRQPSGSRPARPRSP